MTRRAHFIERFVLPLVEGGEVHVGAPLGFGGLSRLADEAADSDAERLLLLARTSVVAEYLPHPAPPPLDEDALRIAISLHDLLFLFHPGAPDPLRGRGHRHVAAGCALLAALELPDDPVELLFRHTLLHRMGDLGRDDTRVTFWVGRREFRGQRPPSRLTAWPKVRRVTEERWRVPCLAEVAGDPLGGGDAVRALLGASPLTSLLDPLRGEPFFDLFGADSDVVPVAPGICAVLRDASLCRVVANRWLELGLDRTGAAFAAQLVKRLGARRHDDLVPQLLSLLCHLHWCLVWAGPEARGELVRAAGRGDPGLTDFLGLFPAVAAVAPALHRPPDVAADPILAAAGADHLRTCLELCPPERVRELRGLLARSLDGVSTLAA